MPDSIRAKFVGEIKRWALWIIPLTFIAFVVRGSLTYRQCVDEKPRQESEQQQPKSTPTLIVILREAITHRWGCSGEFITHNGEEISAVATVIVAIFTLTLWHATRGMRDFAKIQMDDTRILQRAYITVDPGGVEHIWNKPQICRITIKNSGNLPARDVRWIIEGNVFVGKRHRDFDLDMDRIEDSTNILAPKGEMNRFRDINISSDEIRNVRRGDYTLYVWGRVCYLDGFDKERWTDFCHRYESDCFHRGSRRRPAKFGPERARQHQWGNGTDEDKSTDKGAA